MYIKQLYKKNIFIIFLKTDCVLLGLDRYSFKRLIGNIDDSIIEKNYGK